MTRTAETDPHGRPAHAPGSKLDTHKTRAGLAIGGFARALLAVSEVATFGARKYRPHGWVAVPDGAERYTDAMYRHLLAEAAGDVLIGNAERAKAVYCAGNAAGKTVITFAPLQQLSGAIAAAVTHQERVA